MKNTIYNYETLLQSPLVKASTTAAAFEGLEPREWLPGLIEKNLINRKKHLFYEQVADLYGLTYIDQLSAPLNPKDAVAYRVPTDTLISTQLYPFEKSGKLYIATATPFVRKSDLDSVLAFTGRAGYEIVITTPYQLREALKTLYYFEFSIVAQNNLRYSKKRLSASPPIVLRFAKIAVAALCFILIAAFILPKSILIGLFFLINLLYLYLNGVRFVTFFRSIARPKQSAIVIPQKTLDDMDNEWLPRYTVLVPLRHEETIVKDLVRRLASLDYPKAKLEIFFLIGVDDERTFNALQAQGIDTDTPANDLSEYGYYMSIIKVPKVQVDTKPLVCNYGLRFATGDFTVIYDAEDQPEPSQLKKAVAGFQVSSLDTICLQGKLSFYNSDKNLLTRLFALEYGMWFDYFLPGLQLIGSPIPLGGTSNHFITNALRRTGEWDPYNVTEDADIGMRIYRNSQQTKMLDTHTYEEATSTLGAWLKQRSRWEKGFLATLVVHARHPIQMYRELGSKRFVYGVTVFFSNFYMPFINPMLWTITLLWVLNIYSLGTLPVYIWLPAVINLVIGNLTYILIHFLAAIHSKQADLAPLALVVPFYWIFISIATYMAAWDILFHPYRWRKTTHGES